MFSDLLLDVVDLYLLVGISTIFLSPRGSHDGYSMRIIELSNESAVQLHGLDGIAMYVSSSIEALCAASGYYIREVE